MPALVWCTPGCCDYLYLVADTRVWRCPYSNATAHLVVAQYHGLAWSGPATIRQFFREHRQRLGHLADASENEGLESLFDSFGETRGLKQGDRMCDLLRCIVGDPFRPLPPLSSAVLDWNGSIAIKMATSIDEERDFSLARMGVLADALEEAGLDDRLVLSHLRGPGPHCRGCHILDLVMGRS